MKRSLSAAACGCARAAARRLAASSNDRPDISEGLTKVYLDFKKAGVPVELHLYAGGGHGFGVRPGKNAPVDQWIVRFEEWLR